MSKVIDEYVKLLNEDVKNINEVLATTAAVAGTAALAAGGMALGTGARNMMLRKKFAQELQAVKTYCSQMLQTMREQGKLVTQQHFDSCVQNKSKSLAMRAAQKIRSQISTCYQTNNPKKCAQELGNEAARYDQLANAANIPNANLGR